MRSFFDLRALITLMAVTLVFQNLNLAGTVISASTLIISIALAITNKHDLIGPFALIGIVAPVYVLAFRFLLDHVMQEEHTKTDYLVSLIQICPNILVIMFARNLDKPAESLARSSLVFLSVALVLLFYKSSQSNYSKNMLGYVNLISIAGLASLFLFVR